MSDHVVTRVKNTVLCCDGVFVGECVGLLLNKQFDHIRDMNIVITENNRNVLLSILQSEFKLLESVDDNEVTIYSKDQECDWDCIHIRMYPSFQCATRDAYFDIDYLSLSSKCVQFIDGCYYTKFIRDIIEIMLERVRSKSFCLSRPYRNATIIMRSLSMIAKGWNMDDFLLPEKSVVIKIQTEKITSSSCTRCCCVIENDNTVTSISNTIYCAKCLTAK